MNINKKFHLKNIGILNHEAFIVVENFYFIGVLGGDVFIYPFIFITTNTDLISIMECQSACTLDGERPLTLLNLPPDLIKVILNHAPKHSMNVAMIKQTCTLLKHFMEQIYPNDHHYIVIQAIYTHNLQNVWHYLPPLESMAHVYALMDTSLKHGHLDNFKWLNQMHPSSNHFEVCKLLAKYHYFELLKTHYRSTTMTENKEENAIESPKHTTRVSKWSSSVISHLKYMEPKSMFNAIPFSSSLATLSVKINYLREYAIYAVQHQNLDMLQWCWITFMLIKQNRPLTSLFVGDHPILPRGIVDNEGNEDAQDSIYRFINNPLLKAIISSKNHDIIQWLYEKDASFPLLFTAIQLGDTLMIRDVYVRYHRSEHEPLTPLMMVKAAENDDLDTLKWLHQLDCPMPDLSRISTPSISGLQWLLKHGQGEKRLSFYHLTSAIRHNVPQTLQWLYKTHHVHPNEHHLILALNLGHFECAAWLWSSLSMINPTLLTQTNWYLNITLTVKSFNWLRAQACCIENYLTSDGSAWSTHKQLDVSSYILHCPSNNDTFQLILKLHEYLPWSINGDEYWSVICNNRLDHMKQLHALGCPLTHVVHEKASIYGSLSMNVWLKAQQCPKPSLSCCWYSFHQTRYYNTLWLLKNYKKIPNDGDNDDDDDEMKDVYIALNKSLHSEDFMALEINTYNPQCQLLFNEFSMLSISFQVERKVKFI